MTFNETLTEDIQQFWYQNMETCRMRQQSSTLTSKFANQNISITKLKKVQLNHVNNKVWEMWLVA